MPATSFALSNLAVISQQSVFRTILALTLMTLAPQIMIVGNSARADEDALTTPAGTPLKVIVREPAALYREADTASPNEPVDVFTFFYLLPATPGGAEKVKNGCFRVAGAAQARRAAGWLPAGKAVEWPHAQTAGFTQFAGRSRVLFFATREDAEAWYRGAADAEAKAISIEPNQKQTALFPLLDIHSFKHDGDDVEVYKVAYLSGQTAAAPSVAPSAPIRVASRDAAPRNREELRKDFALQIAFVLDTTRSMEPWISAMKAVIADVARQLQGNPGLAGRIELALVCYRDQLQDPDDMRQLEYVTKVASRFTSDLNQFQQDVGAIHEASIGSEDFPEDVLAGLQVTIKDLAWKKGAFKHCVLIGDAPAHVAMDGYKNTTKQTIDGILALAQPAGDQAIFDRIQIHALRIEAPHAEECRRQFGQLTAGREYSGLHSAYAQAGDEQKFIADLTARLAELTDVTQSVAQGQFAKVEQQAQQAAPGSVRQRLLGPVIDMLRATAGDTGSTNTFREGFAVTLDREGNRCLEPHVIVSQSQLKLFESAVNHCIVSLETAGDPGARNVAKVVQSLQIMATGINLKEDVHPDMPLAELLSKVLGFPVRNPIFAMTPKRLTEMTGQDFDAWKGQVRASQSIVKNHLENGSIWFTLGRSSGHALDQHAFLKVSDLP